MKRRIHRIALARRSTAAAFTALLVLSGFAWFPWFKGSMPGGRWFGLVPWSIR